MEAHWTTGFTACSAIFVVSVCTPAVGVECLHDPVERRYGEAKVYYCTHDESKSRCFNVDGAGKQGPCARLSLAGQGRKAVGMAVLLAGGGDGRYSASKRLRGGRRWGMFSNRRLVTRPLGRLLWLAVYLYTVSCLAMCDEAVGALKTWGAARQTAGGSVCLQATCCLVVCGLRLLE